MKTILRLDSQSVVNNTNLQISFENIRPLSFRGKGVINFLQLNLNRDTCLAAPDLISIKEKLFLKRHEL